MKPYQFLPLLAAFVINSAPAQTTSLCIPQVSGKDLNNKPWTAPADFPGKRTLVIVAFEEVQQTNVDTWTEGLGLKVPSNKLPWIEMPLIQNPGMFMRWFINTGMRGGISDKETRGHVWSAYTDKKAFMQACGMNTDQTVYALVVDRAGHILSMEAGNYSKEAASRLVRCLKRQAANSGW
jgi:hypothetical protein